jgi:hypothetical protein
MTQRPFLIGSVTTPVKRALIEMLMHGALRREKGIWKSCDGKKFLDQTVTSLVKRNLAIISVNQAYAGAQFARLNEIGAYVAKAVRLERDQRAACVPLEVRAQVEAVPA